jgi:hypothetical protein
MTEEASGLIPTGPNLDEIGVSENEVENRVLIAAAKQLYKKAKALQGIGVVLSIALAIFAPILLYLWPNEGPILGAFSGAWIFITRIVIQPSQLRLNARGAALQEEFDCQIFGIPRNPSITNAPSPEETRSLTRRVDLGDFSNWYAISDGHEWPRSVLICQRANAVWARRQNRSYGRTLVAFSTLLIAVGILVALVHHAQLSTYLVIIALPSLPALLDMTELFQSHFREAGDREKLESLINSQLSDSSSVLGDVLRRNQDQIYALRAKAPPIPQWFYELVRPNLEESMQHTVQNQKKAE